jgi:hypothetical protein
MPMEALIPAPIKGAVTDKTVQGDLESPRWTRPGPAGCSARPRSHSAIWRASSTSLGRWSEAAAQPTTFSEWISTTKAAQTTAGQAAHTRNQPPGGGRARTH